MREIVKVDLPDVTSPVEWATMKNGVLYTAQIPIHADGTLETGCIRDQAELTMNNLKKTVKSAGGSMCDVTQVLIYITNPEEFSVVNEVYRSYFEKPYPNRATVVAAGLVAPGTTIEVVAYAHI